METELFDDGGVSSEYVDSNYQQDTGTQELIEAEQDSTPSNSMSDPDVFESLSNLYETLKEPLPCDPSASYISDAAHKLVDGLNAKRKIDSELIEKFKQSLEAQTMKYVQALEQQLYETYEVQNIQVDKKLQELFACLDNISATEVELENFRESLRRLYQEMNCTE